MYFKTPQGMIRLTENVNKGILITVDEDDVEQQAHASMTIEMAERFVQELNNLIERKRK